MHRQADGTRESYLFKSCWPHEENLIRFTIEFPKYMQPLKDRQPVHALWWAGWGLAVRKERLIELGHVPPDFATQWVPVSWLSKVTFPESGVRLQPCSHSSEKLPPSTRKTVLKHLPRCSSGTIQNSAVHCAILFFSWFYQDSFSW